MFVCLCVRTCSVLNILTLHISALAVSTLLSYSGLAGNTRAKEHQAFSPLVGRKARGSTVVLVRAVQFLAKQPRIGFHCFCSS
jgi:hypothetical protein